MQDNDDQEKQYTTVDKGMFDSRPSPTQIYSFKWTIQNLKEKLENPLTHENIEAEDFQIKDKKTNGNEMTLALSLSVKQDSYWEHHLFASLFKKSMTCQDVTICWGVTIESHGENGDKKEFKLQKNIVTLTNKRIEHKNSVDYKYMKDSPIYIITLYMEVIWPEKNNIYETRTEKNEQIKGVIVEHMMNGKYADIKLTCKDKEFKCHKIILAAHSPVFDRMFSNDDNSELQQGVVVIIDMEPEELEAFLKFFYTGRFDESMKHNAKALLAAADKYDVRDLMTLAEEELVKTLVLENAIDMLLLAHLHEVNNLRKTALQKIINNFGKISDQQQWKDLKGGKCEMVALVEAFVHIFGGAHNCF